MNDDLKEKLKFNIAISKIKEEEKKHMNTNKEKINKGLGFAACIILATTGVVFATNYDNIKDYFDYSSRGLGERY